MKRLWLLLIGCIVLLIGVWQYLSNTYKEEEKELRTQIRKTVKEMFPEHAAESSQTFGLFLFDADRGLPREKLLARKTVILIHGLDDPGCTSSKNFGPKTASAKRQFLISP